jgi:hypothetical protein
MDIMRTPPNIRSRNFRVHFEEGVIGVLRKVCAMAMDPHASYKVAFHERQFEVFVDASLSHIGITDAKKKFMKSIKYEGPEFEKFEWPSEPNINLYEIWAIYMAVNLAPTKCTLRIVTDNNTALKMFKRTGEYLSHQAALITATERLVASKDIAVCLSWICTAHQPADEPSRELRSIRPHEE